MSINLLKLLLILNLTGAIFQANAVNMIDSGTGNNSFLFIENNVDNEYFITPNSLDPRFSGSNIWTKYSTNQNSLGYMGFVLWTNANRFFDMWISDSPISQPFQGIRCMTIGSTCPSTGFIAGEHIDNNGFYHTKSGSSVYNGSYGFASFTPAAYEYFRALSVGSLNSFTLNYCHTATDYDYGSGMRCKDLPSGASWYAYKMNITKAAHLRLNSTGALSEIWIASDGTPSVNSDSDNYCQPGIVGSAEGLICKMVDYNYQESITLGSSLRFRMLIDAAQLGFSPAATDVKYSGNTTAWYNYNSDRAYKDVITPGGKYIYIFLSDSFFKKVLNAGKDLTNKDSLFTFYFNNTNTPESGYYQFTASNQLNLIPKEYAISIVSTDGKPRPKAAGSVGSQKPIEFEYRITTSALRQADSITAQVIGESTKILNIPYCIFTSTDNTLKVPIPAYLVYTSFSGAKVTKRNSCSDAPIELVDANWTQTPWGGAENTGYFFSTRLNLLFPMDDSRSQFTVDGTDWLGTVSASGEVKVTAHWVGVDIDG